LTFLLIACLVVFAYIRYGGPTRAAAVYTGRSIVVEPERIDLGDIPVGALRRFDVSLINVAGSPAKILAIVPGCTCTYQGDALPFTVDGNRRRQLTFSLHAASKPERLEFAIAVVVARESRPTVLNVLARIVEDGSTIASAGTSR
jgi:hypothetical protein